MSKSVTTKGNVVKTEISKVDVSIANSMNEIINDVIKQTHKDVYDKAPERTGAYKSSISYKTDEVNTKDGSYITATVYVKSPHYRLSHLLEFGTHGEHPQSPQPHMRPAFDKNYPVYISKLKAIDVENNNK